MNSLTCQDEAPLSVNAPTHSTRHTDFALKQSKLTKNLKKDAISTNYETVINNYDENINLKCSSGF